MIIWSYPLIKKWWSKLWMPRIDLYLETFLGCFYPSPPSVMTTPYTTLLDTFNCPISSKLWFYNVTSWWVWGEGIACKLECACADEMLPYELGNNRYSELLILVWVWSWDMILLQNAFTLSISYSRGIKRIVHIILLWYFRSCCAACAPFYKNIMAFVPIGVAVIAFLTLLFVRKRKTDYILVTPEGEQYTCSNSANGVVKNYGSINNKGKTVSISSGACDSATHDSGLVSEQEDEPSDMPTPSVTAPLIPASNTASLRVTAAARERQRMSSGGSNSTPRKPSFIVGSTPPADHI